ncbi:MAG: hypothetical protein QOJ16_2188 [Acidobacteriota bacterium]|jgi:archaellum component FlaC|nr:hypothetical protein [Acidobacteriota bacterium]
MDTELIAYLDERFGKIDERFQKIDERFEKIDQRFEKIDQRFEKMEDTLHLTQVAVEGVRDEVKLLAEGMIGTEEKLSSLSREVTFQYERLQASIAPYYKDLDCRIRLLEERAAREGQAPLDIIRERYGKTS